MIHPLFRLIATQPQLLADHLEAYADLVGEEVGQAAAQMKRRLLWQSVGAGLALLAVVLGGVALLLWAAIPTDAMPAPWALWVVPGVPALAAALCLMSSRVAAQPAFANVRRQLAADAALLREAGEA